MKKATVLAAVSVLMLGLAAASLLPTRSAPDRAEAATPQAIWYEVPWPFPIDQWGTGKTFVCRAADCGAQVTVYLRAKIGFCNCTAGVADDEELDRISDF